MSNLTRGMMMGAAGASGDKVYVDDVFSTYLYTGTNSAQTITNGIDISGEGGLVWIKNRDSSTQDHAIYDTERGAGQTLNSSTTGAQFLSTARLSALNSNGFTVGSDNATNQSGSGIASWTFRKAPGFFDVVTYTGSGSGTKTISHNLGSVPGMIICKGLNGGSDWSVYHRSLNGGSSPEDYYLRLNGTTAESNAVANWGGTAPTATQFTVGGNANASLNYVAYIFAHDEASFGTDEDESIIKCGSYNVDGSGLFDVNLGWEPQWLLYKRADGSEDWAILDTQRDWTVRSLSRLWPNLSNSEQQNINEGYFQPYAQGFRSTSAFFGGNRTYIYMAIRRPHKPPEAGTEVFAIDTLGATSPSPPGWTSGFVIDWLLRKTSTNTSNWESITRLTNKLLYTDLTNAEGTLNANDRLDYNEGWGSYTATNSVNYSWMFKRAPGFMDVVAFTGTGSTRTVNHNLTVTPELMIIKLRNEVNNWAVYYGDNTHYMRLNSPSSGADSAAWWNDTSPTSTEFTVGTDPEVNKSGYYLIAYLFATLPGISKVGSYSGSTGYNVNVDCGFTNGARFILIKRTDASGDWYVYDTARGIVSGNDPYLFLNTAAAEVTNTDYIDPLNAGFTVTSSAPDALNVNGGTYIFLAIA